jgi:hypothetical protein
MTGPGEQSLGDLASATTLRLAQLKKSMHVNPAEWMHERIVRSINDFEGGLDKDHEIGARLVTFGVDFVFHIADVGYWGPDIIIFHGVDQSGQKVQLLQHISQLSVLLVALDAKDGKARRIGFRLMNTIEEDKA